MKRTALIALLGLLTGSLAYAQKSPPVIKIIGFGGKSVEGGIAVNPVTHKAYVLAELDAEGADDAKTVFVFDDNVLNGLGAPKTIAIPNENEYIAIDPIRNLIYVPTKFSVEGPESDDDAEGGDEVDTGVDPPEAPVPGEPVVKLGTLTVIDGNTDTVIATVVFPYGVEPEGVAVDTAHSVVYVAAKAPEGESDAADDYCASGTPIFDVGEPGDVECWTAGRIYTFFVDPNASPVVTYLKAIRAGDDPESLVFQNGMVYAANEDDGTVTIASLVYPDGTGGALLTDSSRPPANPYHPYQLGYVPYSLAVFYPYGPNPLGCIENKYEADKMAAGGGRCSSQTIDRVLRRSSEPVSST